MTDLKRCPFCGGEASYDTMFNGNWYVYVRCNKCYARGKDIESSIDYCARDKAREKWNTRTEQKTGRWIDDNCSVCGQYVHHGDARNYCPNCGAKMEDDHET